METLKPNRFNIRYALLGIAIGWFAATLQHALPHQQAQAASPAPVSKPIPLDVTCTFDFPPLAANEVDPD